MIDAREIARKSILGAAHYSGISSIAAPFLAGAGAILMLHRVTESPRSPLGLNSHLAISPHFLDGLLADLKRSGASIVSLDELLDELGSGRGRRLVAITADDAYLDNLREALPVLETHGAPFTVYVAPGLTSGKVLPWWEVVEEMAAQRDRLEFSVSGERQTLDCSTPRLKRDAARRLMEHIAGEIPEADQQQFLRELGAEDLGGTPRRFMDWDEIRWLSAHPLATIGAHTVHHYNLMRLPEEMAMLEMIRSAAIIADETGARPRHFAFPYGYEAAVGEREVRLARQAGFASAVTTRHGVLQAGHAEQPHALPRISVNGRFQRVGYVRTLLSGITTPLSNGGKRFVTI